MIYLNLECLSDRIAKPKQCNISSCRDVDHLRISRASSSPLPDNNRPAITRYCSTVFT
eukprot:m.438878 g.438878  ORF g.438878 m.438878 type:complete len:58 (+) comp18297_c0_seq1:1589-1762(+)